MTRSGTTSPVWNLISVTVPSLHTPDGRHNSLFGWILSAYPVEIGLSLCAVLVEQLLRSCLGLRVQVTLFFAMPTKTSGDTVCATTVASECPITLKLRTLICTRSDWTPAAVPDKNR